MHACVCVCVSIPIPKLPKFACSVCVLSNRSVSFINMVLEITKAPHSTNLWALARPPPRQRLRDWIMTSQALANRPGRFATKQSEKPQICQVCPSPATHLEMRRFRMRGRPPQTARSGHIKNKGTPKTWIRPSQSKTTSPQPKRSQFVQTGFKNYKGQQKRKW